MNGAVSLLTTLGANGVEVCFSNPGTSEMHFVAALDAVSEVRGVLCLFEGVATGAADGYARIAGRPAATLLHLGPGLANGLANLHNARRARVPLLNIVGDHATTHTRFDAPLESDIAALAGWASSFVRRSAHPDDVARDVVDALTATSGPPASIATLVLPADVSWSERTTPLEVVPTFRPRKPNPPDAELVETAARLLRSARCALIIGGGAMDADGLDLAVRIGAATGVKVISETFPTKARRGAGIHAPERLIYLSEWAISQLEGIEYAIVIGAATPVGFFGYPDIASELLPSRCQVLTVCPPDTDAHATLAGLVELLGAPPIAPMEGVRPDAPTGALNAQSMAAAVGATLVEEAIIVDESNTSGIHLAGATQFAPPHDVLTLTGGSIGFGLPTALGAALAGQGRRVLALESDGSMMYTLQALWTMARENLDVTVVGLSNRSYAILNLELARVGADGDGAQAQRMLELDHPTLDLAALARAQGVPAVTVTTADELTIALERSYATPGPSFIEAVLPKGLG